MKRTDPKYPTLTPLRAMDLLEYLTSNWSDAAKLDRARGELRDHIKAVLVRKKRRARK